ncbi:MAG TPA: hypothetical protein VGN34_12755, partial [Ktedonobacteraceae bacterium]
MPDRPYSRFTREKTQAAMYAQHILARFALVPYSKRVNAIAVISCPSVEETTAKNGELWKRAPECDEFFKSGKPLEKAPKFLEGIRYAVILGRSSDFYRYN